MTFRMYCMAVKLSSENGGTGSIRGSRRVVLGGSRIRTRSSDVVSVFVEPAYCKNMRAIAKTTRSSSGGSPPNVGVAERSSC